MNTEINILMVDDDDLLRSVCCKELANKGYCVEEAVDGDQAYRKLLIGEYDLVVLDLGLPKMGGLDLLRVLSTKMPKFPNKKMVIYTNCDDQEMILKVQEFDVKEILKKANCTPCELADEVERLLRD